MSGVREALESARPLFEAFADERSREPVSFLPGRANLPSSAAVIEQLRQDIVEWWPDVVHAVTSLAGAKVLSGDVVLVQGHPVQRVRVRIDRRILRLSPAGLLEQVFWDAVASRSRTGTPSPGPQTRATISAALAAVEPAVSAALAPVRADVANAAAAALVDERVVSKVKGKLAKKRALLRDRLLRELKSSIKRNPGVLSRDDVSQAWDEAVCEQVMES